ncbi:hypothetical protein [Celerinatantimonas sp. MCCC 1A17872]|uniref:hypothetical protein n=1 Tax=Celerinatantimonas sp. MCCC 1A17872 TaxID=3177514 RepID=UPI0038C31D47
MGTAVLYSSLPRGVRNNNPLNIRKGQSWNGLAPVQLDSSFNTFVTPLYGFRAAARIIKGAYHQRGVITLQEVITEWAPPSENPTTQYIEFVADKAQISPADDAVDYLPRVLWAMAQYEQGADYYGLAMAEQGAKLA